VRGDECFAELGEVRLVLLDNNELVGVGPAIRPHRHGFAAEDQLGAAFTEPAPAPEDIAGDAAAGRAIPAFHRLNGAAVAEALAVD